jgi:hypothetical protein
MLSGKERRSPCPHKQQRSLQKRLLSAQKSLMRGCRSPEKTGRLLVENEQLRKENLIYQEYFCTFEERIKEQKRENEQLRQQLNEMKTSRQAISSDRRTEVTHCASEGHPHKLSRTTKASRGVNNEYLILD